MTATGTDAGKAPTLIGRVVVGRGVLDVGGREGSRFQSAPRGSGVVNPELVAALGPEGSEDREPAERFKAIVADASQATDAIDRARTLFAVAVTGNVADRTAMDTEITVLLGALNRLDRDGDHAEALELARALADLLTLVERWWDLVQTLLTARRVLPTPDVEGWVCHELGTLSAAAGRQSHARHLLKKAYRLREQVSDHEGAAATAQNLALTNVRSGPTPIHGPFRALRSGCIAGAVAAAIVGGVVVGTGFRVFHNSRRHAPTLTIDGSSSKPTFSGRYVVDTHTPFHGNVHIVTPREGVLLWRAKSDGTGDFVAHGPAATPPLIAGTYYAWLTQAVKQGTHAMSNVVAFVVGPTTTQTTPSNTATPPKVFIEHPTQGDQVTSATTLWINGSVAGSVPNVQVSVSDVSTSSPQPIYTSAHLGTGGNRWAVPHADVLGFSNQLICNDTYQIQAIGLTGSASPPSAVVDFTESYSC